MRSLVKYENSQEDNGWNPPISKVKDALDDLESEMIQIMKSLGMSGDLKNYYRTDSEEYRKFTQATFTFQLESGLGKTDYLNLELGF